MTASEEMHAEMTRLTEALHRDVDKLHAELQIRLAGAPQRAEIDAAFTYRVLFLAALNKRLQPYVRETTLYKMAVFDVIALELAQEHQDGEV